MQEYIGTKRIKAQPMTRGVYNTYRGWEIPLDENPTDDGMLVEYMDGGQANHPDHEGYISWSPQAVFEKSYKPSGTHVERMQIEAQELEEKKDKLLDFINNNPKFGELADRAQRLMVEQYKAMEEYFNILQFRMEEA